MKKTAAAALLLAACLAGPAWALRANVNSVQGHRVAGGMLFGEMTIELQALGQAFGQMFGGMFGGFGAAANTASF